MTSISLTDGALAMWRQCPVESRVFGISSRLERTRLSRLHAVRLQGNLLLPRGQDEVVELFDNDRWLQYASGLQLQGNPKAVG